MLSEFDIKKVKEIVKESGKICENFYYKNDIDIKNKDEAGESIVTEADLAVNSFLIENLDQSFSGIGFFSEETGGNTKNEFCWVIDPIDGTTNFAHKIPYFCISLALTRNNVPILAFIYDPLRKELFFAQKDQGSFLNDKKIKCSETFNLFAIEYSYNQDPLFEKWISMMSRCKDCHILPRIFGSIALNLANLSAGRLDAVVSSKMNWWDVAAGILLIQEAGGIVTDINQKKLSIQFDSMVASNSKNYTKIINLL